jgi:hypothetical protein
MFNKYYQYIISVHDDVVYWFSGDICDNDRHIFQIPLQQLLDSDTPHLLLPDWLKSGRKTLCIIPDHWFSSQSYSFQSKKPSLIEPFLERRLLASQPNQKKNRHFFSYRSNGDSGRSKLTATYLQEDRSYLLYSVLKKLNHAPQLITAPAFLWEDTIQQAVDDFSNFGTLLIHLTGQEYQLYFYHLGRYLFSRSVPATDGDDSLVALGYEINQSLYMFSQTAKSELDRIYMYGDSDRCRETLSEIVGRDIIDINPFVDSGASEALKIPQLAILSGWLKRSQLHSGAGFFGIMHRQVKQAIEWRPVLWTGTIVGLLLFLGLIGEHFILRAMLNAAQHNSLALQRQIIAASSSVALSEYPDTLEQLLSRARRSMLVDAVHRLPVSFHSQLKLRKLEFAAGPESVPTLKIVAWVQAHDAEELQNMLKELIGELEGRFQDTPSLTLNDFEIRMNRAGEQQGPNRYQIEFALEMT